LHRPRKLGYKFSRKVSKFQHNNWILSLWAEFDSNLAKYANADNKKFGQLWLEKSGRLTKIISNFFFPSRNYHQRQINKKEISWEKNGRKTNFQPFLHHWFNHKWHFKNPLRGDLSLQCRINFLKWVFKEGCALTFL
jgi:hypothetical protein